jgi:hypothetical protein
MINWVIRSQCVSVGYALSRQNCHVVNQKSHIHWLGINLGLQDERLVSHDMVCLQLLNCFPHGDRIITRFISVTLHGALPYNTNLLESVNCVNYFIWYLVFFNSFSIWSSRVCSWNTERILVMLASGYLLTIQVHCLSDSWPIQYGRTFQTYSVMLKNRSACKYPMSSLFHEPRN